MANYKGIEVDPEIRSVLPHMSGVEEYRESLQVLQALWDNLTLLGQLSGTTTELGGTREEFAGLTGELLNCLAERTLAKCVQELAAKSQVIIDILVRNLFERTADIGFLATDDEIRRFMAAPGDCGGIVARFREYVSKYSVYEDVVLLSPDGKVLARLADNPEVTQISDAWVAEAMQTQAAYVEAFGASDLFPGSRESLIYAYRVEQRGVGTLGVLGLCFRFPDEMKRIFAALGQGDNPAVMALLDGQGRVIATSDRWQLPLDAEIVLPTGGMRRLRFAGRAYLAYASETRGYQGYFGPGWRGAVLVPLDQAFEASAEQAALDIPERLLPSVLKGTRAFPEKVQAIPRQAESIQRSLGRSVWNGLVRHREDRASVNAGFSRILLSEISRTGMRMREVFSQSIQNLQSTVLSALMADSQFLAGLAIDIMDRNLYERANDCRWWALDPVIVRVLQSATGQGAQESLQTVLRYINGLYTVYSNLLVFDIDGKVLAVSNPDYAAWVGEQVAEPWVGSALKLRSTQAYAVSQFVPTPLYAGRPTYIYTAAVRSEDGQRVVGGVGIVFDSAPQFQAMLSDVLPREADGTPVAGSFAVFVDGTGQVIASTNEGIVPGQQLDLPSEVLTAGEGGVSCIFEREGIVYALGAGRSTGYREFKSASDAYRNEVTAVVFVPLADYDARAAIGAVTATIGRESMRGGHEADCLGIATFHLGEHWLGVPAETVVEAIELTDATRLANAPKHVYGALMYRGNPLPLYNLHAALGVELRAGAEEAIQVVVLSGGNGKRFGIIVEGLGDVPEVPRSDIADISSIYVGMTPILASVVKSNPANGPLLTVLSVESIEQQLREAAQFA